MTRRLPILAAFLALLLGAGCSSVTDYKPPAVGKTAEIVVVTDSASWSGVVGDALRDALGYEMRTFPQPTPSFTLRLQPLSDFALSGIRRQNGVVFAAALDDTTATARFIRARLDSTGAAALQAGGQGIITRPDLWMRDQLVVYATAPTDSALAAQIRAAGPRLRAGFNALARKRTTDDMFEKARQTDVEETLLDDHGFAVNIQHDYFIVQDTTFVTPDGLRAGFVRFRRIPGDTWRDLFIYYEDDPRFTRLHPDSVRAVRNRLTEEFVQGVHPGSYITIEDRAPDLRPIVADTVGLGGRFAIETRGTWRMTGDAMGGPFVSYALYDEDQGRFYLIDGAIYAPRYTIPEKREFLRQMEAIAHTFRTSAGDAPEVVADAEPPPPESPTR